MNKGFDDIISKISECGTKTVAVAVAQDSAVLDNPAFGKHHEGTEGFPSAAEAPDHAP